MSIVIVSVDSSLRYERRKNKLSRHEMCDAPVNKYYIHLIYNHETENDSNVSELKTNSLYMVRSYM